MTASDPRRDIAAEGASAAQTGSAEPTERELEARIEAEKASIADTLRMFSEKAQNEVAQVGQLMSDYALPACGAAAVLGWLLAPRRRRPAAVIRLETPSGEEPAVTVQEPGGGLSWSLLGGMLGGAVVAGVAAYFWKQSALPAGEYAPIEPAPELGTAVPPVHIGYESSAGMHAAGPRRLTNPISGAAGPLAEESGLMP